MKTEEIIQLSPLVKRITAGNASVFTGPGTNTYLVGNNNVTVVDPGPALDSHIEAIVKASDSIKQIIVTHTHPDHSPGVKLLQEAIDVPAYGLITDTTKDQDKTFSPAKLLSDGDVLGAIYTCIKDFNVDLYVGIGGAPEGVLAAAAIKCFGGQFQGRLSITDNEEKLRATKLGITDLKKKYYLNVYVVDVLHPQLIYLPTYL